MIKVSPSVLSADFSKLGNEVNDVTAAGADYVHLDVMDGHFVNNISFGLPVIKSLRSSSDAFFDVHLMIDEPVKYVARFCDSGADLVNVHIEADSEQNIDSAIEIIKQHGKKAGVTVKPATPASAVRRYVEKVDLVLIMTVEPGAGGQSFMYDMLPKITEVRKIISELNPNCELEVDGGINNKTAPLAVSAGADVLVAGSYVFGANDRGAAIASLKNF